MKSVFKKYWLPITLLATDFTLIVLHFVNFWMPIGRYNAFYMESNNSYAEYFQNFKWVAMIVLSIMIARRKQEKKYYSWTILFMFLSLEDLFRIHQVITSFISQTILGGITTRQWKILEIVVASIVGLAVILPLIINYRKAGATFRRQSKVLFGLLMVLVFFGIVIDQAHRLYYVWDNWKRDFIVGIIEDGGEMLTASCILIFLFLVWKHNFSGKAVIKN